MMKRRKKMILEVKRFPESQEVMDNKEWFPIGDYGENIIIGDSAYARVLDKEKEDEQSNSND